mmetsp:Transcript_14594/g.21999  ORF Transcript_14594/g.21999 Transcript_14594/m.21999 type:complete len:243 (-) Transcript_14594:91-819(-)
MGLVLTGGDTLLVACSDSVNYFVTALFTIFPFPTARIRVPGWFGGTSAVLIQVREVIGISPSLSVYPCKPEVDVPLGMTPAYCTLGIGIEQFRSLGTGTVAKCHANRSPLPTHHVVLFILEDFLYVLKFFPCTRCNFTGGLFVSSALLETEDVAGPCVEPVLQALGGVKLIVHLIHIGINLIHLSALCSKLFKSSSAQLLCGGCLLLDASNRLLRLALSISGLSQHLLIGCSTIHTNRNFCL